VRVREFFASFRQRRPPGDRAAGGGGVLSEPELWALLRELDVPRHLEYPRGFRWRAARAKFDELVELLNRAFDCTTDVDRTAQDSSCFGRIVIPAAATASGEHLTICVSNFGDLAAPTLGTPDSYSEEESQLLFDRTTGLASTAPCRPWGTSSCPSSRSAPATTGRSRPVTPPRTRGPGGTASSADCDRPRSTKMRPLRMQHCDRI
jgi:hypothetical protein